MEPVIKTVSPIIISASRATDIPAFFSTWFFHRFEKGFVKWTNPFNANFSQYVSFRNARVIVFWTKYPKPFIPYLHRLDERNINYYFHFTLNDYDRENFEPGVPPLAERIDIFRELSDRIGKERVIWRFDPLILTETVPVSELLRRVQLTGDKLIHFTDKLVFSFADISIYKKVRDNLIRLRPDFFSRENVTGSEFTPDQKIEFAEGLQQLVSRWKKFNPAFTAATCAEDIDLEKFKITHNKCIDDALMIKLFPEDELLMDFLGFDFKRRVSVEPKKRLKDKGQRKYCGCITSKDIGFYNSCSYYCAYCYANTRRNAVAGKKTRQTSEVYTHAK